KLLLSERRMALLLEDVEGREVRACTGLFLREGDVAAALGLEELGDLDKRVDALIGAGVALSSLERIAILAKLSELASMMPRLVEKAPVMARVLEGDDASLAILPAFKFWPSEASPSITCGVVIAGDGDGGYVVASTRLQILEDDVACIHVARPSPLARVVEGAERRGEEVPAAVILSPPLPMLLASRMPQLGGVDPYALASAIAGGGMPFFREPELGLYVPAEAEVVLTGYIDPGDKRAEGPLGWPSGFYSPPQLQPAFHLSKVYMRDDAVVYFTLPYRGRFDEYWIQRTVDRLLSRVYSRLIPGVVRVATHPPELGRILVVAVDKKGAGRGRLAAMALAGMLPSPYIKLIVTVDPWVRVEDAGEVLWALATNVDPERDVVKLRGVQADELDSPASGGELRALICVDATCKTREELGREPPPRLESLKEMEERVRAMLPELLEALGG
ncbi:MAG: hypothetical protein DRJ96_09055, partial [Thermoprotei archaeon]